MKRLKLDANANERRDEYFALINMIGYAHDIARTLGVSSAVAHMDAARLALVNELQTEFPAGISNDGVRQLATTRAGHC